MRAGLFLLFFRIEFLDFSNRILRSISATEVFSNRISDFSNRIFRIEFIFRLVEKYFSNRIFGFSNRIRKIRIEFSIFSKITKISTRILFEKVNYIRKMKILFEKPVFSNRISDRPAGNLVFSNIISSFFEYNFIFRLVEKILKITLVLLLPDMFNYTAVYVIDI